MSFNFGAQRDRQQQHTAQANEPWAPAQPMLRELLASLPTGASLGTLSGGQQDAFTRLRELYTRNNPVVDDARTVSRDLVDTPDRTGVIDTAYGNLERRLTPTADGTNLNVENNPYIQRMLQQVGDDAQTRIGSIFAGAGRDLSGTHNIETGRGVAAAQLPILFDQFNREQGRTDAAARDLHTARVGDTQTQGAMDEARARLRALGLEIGNAADTAETGQAERLLELENQFRRLPMEQQGWLAQILQGLGGMGGTQTGESTTNRDRIGGNVGFRFV